jgi:hypothetical protein
VGDRIGVQSGRQLGVVLLEELGASGGLSGISRHTERASRRQPDQRCRIPEGGEE